MLSVRRAILGYLAALLRTKPSERQCSAHAGDGRLNDGPRIMAELRFSPRGRRPAAGFPFGKQFQQVQPTRATAG